MGGLYLELVFRIGFASACVGVALYARLAYLQKNERPVPKPLLMAASASKVLTITTFLLVLLLGFWPFDPSLLNDFFHRLNRVIHVF